MHGFDTAHISFYVRIRMCVHARLMMSNLLFGSLLYELDVCTVTCKCTCACQECTHQIWIVCILECMPIVS